MKFEEKVAELRLKKYKGKESKEFLADVVRLTQGEPLGYVMGFMDFLGVRIDLSMHPMIPRMETGFWLMSIIDELKKRGGDLYFLDAFAGSGNIGAALAKHVPQAKVDISEYDESLIAQINITLKNNHLDREGVRVFSGDMLEGATGPYDVICANPPYIAPVYREEVMSELVHEPPLAFFDKTDGTYYHTYMIEHAHEFLKPKGFLIMESDTEQREGIERVVMRIPQWEKYEWKKDMYGQECVLVLYKK